MGNACKWTFEKLEFILRLLEEKKSNTDDQAELQMIEEIEKTIKTAQF